MKKLASIIAALTVVSSSNVVAGDFSVSLGNFAFSDSKKHAGMLDINYNFTEKNVDTFVGVIRPQAGLFVTNRLSSMLYAGVYTNYKISYFNITPSFTPGFYSSGEGKRGKDLGSTFQMKSQVNVGLNLDKFSSFNLGYSHISNGGIGKNNPGANSYNLNFLKQF